VPKLTPSTAKLTYAMARLSVAVTWQELPEIVPLSACPDVGCCQATWSLTRAIDGRWARAVHHAPRWRAEPRPSRLL
jgi:hypothetical protein